MSKLIRTVLIGIAPIALLGLGAEVHAQANDVDCTRCVDGKDIAREAVTTNKIGKRAVTTGKIAPEAITTGKIADGAITGKKVSPKLKNAIGTFCVPGQVVIGMDDNGNFVCESPLYYFPFGPQKNVPETDLRGWTQCYSDLYNNPLDSNSVATILGQCDKDKLLLACRPVGDTRFTLLAAGNRAAVLTDTGAANNGITTLDNGTGWYFNDSWKADVPLARSR